MVLVRNSLPEYIRLYRMPLLLSDRFLRNRRSIWYRYCSRICSTYRNAVPAVQTRSVQRSESLLQTFCTGIRNYEIIKGLDAVDVSGLCFHFIWLAVFKERMSEMLANIIIMALILGYCAYIIYKNVKNAKEGKHMGCSGCSGNCGSCGGCSAAAGKSQYTKKK